jgi:glycosyltransferase involved in cell wall biosynthesis
MEDKRIFIRYQSTLFEMIEHIHAEAKEQRDRTIGQLGFRRFNFIYVGRLASEKNIDSLLRAFNLVLCSSRNASEWGLIIVGEGNERPRLERVVQEHKINGVFFVGGKSWKEVPLYYALSDLLILPSFSEPWGLVVNEAMICGLPVLVSNRCGSAYDLVIEGGNGFTFDPLNWQALAQKMAVFVNEEVDRQEMGRLSRKIIDAYRPEETAKQMFKGIIAA